MNEVTVEDMDWLHLVTYFLAQAVYCTYIENMWIVFVYVAFQIAKLNVIVLTLVLYSPLVSICPHLVFAPTHCSKLIVLT